MSGLHRISRALLLAPIVTPLLFLVADAEANSLGKLFAIIIGIGFTLGLIRVFSGKKRGKEPNQVQQVLTTLCYWLLAFFTFIFIVHFIHIKFFGGINVLFPFLTPKTLFFRSSAIIAVALFLYYVLRGGVLYIHRLRMPFVWVPAGLAFVTAISSFFGIDWYHSLWSTFERGDGLFTLFSAIVWFYITLLLAEKKFILRLSHAVSVVGSLVALYGVFQWLEYVFQSNIFFIISLDGRIGSTLGNAAFLASFLGLSVVLTMLYARSVEGSQRVLAYGSALLQLCMIIISATRGTLLALILVGVAIITYYAFRGTGTIKKITSRLLIGVVFVFLLFIGFRGYLAQSSFEPIARIASVSLKESSVANRIAVWQGVLHESVKHPFLGVGAEHVGVLFNAIYDPSVISEQWFDRSHNAYIDYLAQYGIFGLLMYILLIIALFRVGIRLLRNEHAYALYIFAFIGIYAIQNFFVFDTAITFWLLLIFLCAMIVHLDDSEEMHGLIKKPLPLTVAVIGSVVILTALIPVTIYPLQANIKLAQGYNVHIVQPGIALNYFEEGYGLHTYANLEYGYQLYSMYTERQVNILSGQARAEAYRYALNILTENYRRYPYDAKTAVYLGHVLDLAPPEVARDDALLKEVIMHLRELSPKRMQGWLLEANMYIREAARADSDSLQKEAYRKAIAVLDNYIGIVPDDSESYYVIAGFSVLLGDIESAQTYAEQGRNLYRPSDDMDYEIAGRALQYYLQFEDWENALFFLEYMVDAETSTDYSRVYDLAKLYFLTDQYEKMFPIMERINKEDPAIIMSDPVFVEKLKTLE